MSEYNAGDVVRLKSGGLLMTASEIENGNVNCYWFEPSGNVKIQNFPVEVLEKHVQDAKA